MFCWRNNFKGKKEKPHYCVSKMENSFLRVPRYLCAILSATLLATTLPVAGWHIKYGWFCNSCVHSTFLHKQCLFPGCPHCLVYLCARQLRGYRGFPSAVQTHSRISSVWVPFRELQFWGSRLLGSSYERTGLSYVSLQRNYCLCLYYKLWSIYSHM